MIEVFWYGKGQHPRSVHVSNGPDAGDTARDIAKGLERMGFKVFAVSLSALRGVTPFPEYKTVYDEWKAQYE